MGYGRNVRITIDGQGLEAFVRSPFEAKDIIRDMPYRKWNPNLKVWIIPREDVDMLTMKLEEAGFSVTLVDESTQTPPTGGTGDSTDTMIAALQRRIAALEAEKQRISAENVKLRAQVRVNQFNNQFGNQPFGRAGGSWAEDMFKAMTPDQAKAAYKKLSLVCHPDTGGDVELMKLINVAYEKVNK